MVKPIIVINLKTYQWGSSALRLAKKIERVDSNIILGVQPTDVRMITKNTKLQVFSQHVDPFLPGRHTGFLTPQAAKGAGAKGVFLNHSEHPVPLNSLQETVLQCKKLGLKTLIFAKNLVQAQKIAKLRPNYLVIEPPKLVAGNISVSNAKPKLIQSIAKKLPVPFLVGAGIKTKDDITKAVELGASGVAFSSVITKAKDPAKVLKKLVK